MGPGVDLSPADDIFVGEVEDDDDADEDDEVDEGAAIRVRQRETRLAVSRRGISSNNAGGQTAWASNLISFAPVDDD